MEKMNPKVLVEKKFAEWFLNFKEPEELNFRKLIEFNSFESYCEKYGISTPTVASALKTVLFEKYGEKKGMLFYNKIAKFNLRKRWLTNDYIDIYLKHYDLCKTLLPSNPDNINFSKFKMYAEYNRQYGITSSKNILYETLLEKYERRFGQDYVHKLYKKFGEKFRNRYHTRISKKKRVDISAFLKSAYSLMLNNTTEVTVDHVLNKIEYNDSLLSSKRESFKRFLKILEMLQDTYKYRTINDLYDEITKEFNFSEDTARRYIKNIADNIPKYNNIKKKLGHRGHPYVHLKSVKDFAHYLNSVIMKDDHFFDKIKDDHGFIHHKGYAPLRTWLLFYGYSRFHNKLYELNIDYQDVISHAKLRVLSETRLQSLGRMEHWCYIYYCLKHLRVHWDTYTYYEVVSKIGNFFFNLNRPDLSILLSDSNSFKDFIFSKQKIIKITNAMILNIKQINIDFYHGTNISKLIEKCQKGYQGKHSFLIIVLTGTNKEGNYFLNRLRKSKAEIPIFKHIRILNKDEFNQFIVLNPNYRKSLRSISELFGKGTYIDYYFDQLKKTSEIKENKIKKELPLEYDEDLSTDGWSRRLASLNQNYIIKDNFFPKIQSKLV